MSKFVRHFFCSHRSVAFTLTVLCQAVLVIVPTSAFAKANNNAYVVNFIDGTVDVVDTSTNTITATISGFIAPFCASVSPNGKLLYVCNSDDTIKVVDTESNAISATITLNPSGNPSFVLTPSQPFVAFSRHGDRAFVINTVVNLTFPDLVVIDTASNTVVSKTSFRSVLFAVVVAPNGDKVYFASDNGVLVVDSDSGALITTLAPGHDIRNLALSRNGDRLYASDNTGSGVLVVDTDNNSVVTTVPVPNTGGVTGLALTPDGRHLYAEAFFFAAGNSTVTVIDTRDNSIDTTITANGLTLIALAATRKNHKMLALNEVFSQSATDSTVAVIDTRDNTIVDSVTVGQGARAIATQPPSARPDGDDHDDN